MPRLLIGPLLRHIGDTDATVWVETDEPCEVVVRAGERRHRERTWNVNGHHYALVHVDGLAPGSTTVYEVDLDDEPVWPLGNSDRPPSRIRTLGSGRPLRLAFGSCRYGRGAVTLGDRHFDADALGCLSRLLAGQDDAEWPDGLIMLGDQVYADEASDATKRRISARRDIEKGAKDQVADYEEYTWLYLESWTDPDVRWLFSTVPSCMIFDDHDVRDDWNTSHEWREDMARTDWWAERIIGGLSSYWVYQHLGNLTPAELAETELYQQVRTGAGDGMELLRPFAEHADAEADGAKGTRWSYVRDYGRTRLLMIDSRCGRVLADRARSMVSEEEFAWIEQHAAGDFDHLLIGTSLPWLLARALHDLEAWDEALCDGARGQRLARWGEKLRRAADLEHWASFRKSFDRLGRLIAGVARGEHGPAPATISVLSGDVHHAYAARVEFGEPTSSRVYQLTCSPLNNYVPAAMKVTFRIAWSRAAERFTRVLLGTVTKVPPVEFTWTKLSGPYFGNELAELTITGRHAELQLRQAAPQDDDTELLDLSSVTLSA